MNNMPLTTGQVHTMCGIAAFSAPADSNLNARLLAHHLLTQIEDRGSHASGFAYIDADGSVGMYKNPIPGSQLPLHELPRNAKTVVIHTRYATQGSPKNNRNNHPVISTDNRIALVHNGVISNDYALREELGLTDAHGEVDSLVIPSLIAQQGEKALSKLSGYAAIAWLDVENPEILSIAKLKNSPVSYTHLPDGTFVMASTAPLLIKALWGAGLEFGGVFDLAETRMLKIKGGFIMDHDRSPVMSYDYGSYRRHANATSGGKGTTTPPTSTTTTVRGSEDGPKTVVIPGSTDEKDVADVVADLEAWRAKRALDDQNIASKAMAMLTGPSDSWTQEEWDDYMDQLDERELLDADLGNLDDAMTCTIGGSASKYGEGFYILDAEGDISHYAELEMLEGQLAWYAKMSRTDNDLFDVDAEINWVNHIMDLGAVDDDGKLISWVDDSADVDEWESPAVRNLQYIREGAQRLASLKGA